MPYEDDMQLICNHVERTLVVSFRNLVKILGLFETQQAALRAGEQFCRDLAWEDETAFETENLIIGDAP